MNKDINIDSKQFNDKKMKIILTTITSSVIFTLVFSTIIYFTLPNEDRFQAITAIMSIGITVIAFLPQIITNYLEKSKATDPILSVFLIMAAVGVLLRLPALRKNLSICRTSNKGTLLVILICIATLIPLFAHVTWQWQSAIYDKPGILAKEILVYSAPISTIITIIVIIWLFNAPKLNKK